MLLFKRICHFVKQVSKQNGNQDFKHMHPSYESANGLQDESNDKQDKPQHCNPIVNPVPFWRGCAPR